MWTKKSFDLIVHASKNMSTTSHGTSTTSATIVPSSDWVQSLWSKRVAKRANNSYIVANI